MARFSCSALCKPEHLKMLLACGLLLLAACRAAAEPIELEPEPAWVRPHRPDLAARIPLEETSNGTHGCWSIDR